MEEKYLVVGDYPANKQDLSFRIDVKVLAITDTVAGAEQKAKKFNGQGFTDIQIWLGHKIPRR